ncbi:MAG: RNA polymerase sigma-70 factor [Bacteroidota bacterium]
MHQDDFILWQAVSRREDIQAYETIFHRYYQVLERYAMKMIGSRELAEEIASDVLVKLWERRHQLVLKRGLKAYLFAATRNQVIDQLRKKGHLVIKREQEFAEPSMTPSPEEEVIVQEIRQVLTRAIASLPPQGQHIFRLSREEGLKYREIADQLNISIKTVETHMRRSLIFLRERARMAYL